MKDRLGEAEEACELYSLYFYLLPDVQTKAEQDPLHSLERHRRLVPL